jgi:predicted nucleic acid-binding protein
VENSALSQDEIARLIRRLEARADSVEIIARHRPLSVDPGDDLVLDLAINGHADTIVSYNLRHLRAPPDPGDELPEGWPSLLDL